MYHTFSTHKTKGKIIVPPVVKLRHAKVLVSPQYPRKKPASGMNSFRIASYAFGDFFSKKTLWRNIGDMLDRCGP